MDPIAQLALAAAVFLAAHFVSSTPLREALVGKIGEKSYLALYSLAAFATLAWMVWAYRQAPAQPLWPGAKLLPTILMPFALILLVGGVLGKNPTAVGQGGLLRGADPVRGVLRITRHPVMWAIMLWAATHLLARGSVKGTIFFGSFLVLAALGTRLIDARRARALGADWQRFAALTSNLPFAAIVQGRNRFAAGEIGLLAALSGLILYGGLLIGHAWLFGLRPY